MEPSLKLLSDTTSVYRNTPAILYGGYFNSGYAKYIAKDWEGATKDFETVVTISDFLIENKLIDMKLDTNGLLLAGASAQGFKKDDVAAKYYSRLAEAKVGGKENEFFYQFLAGHHIQQGDIAGFNKYLNLARQAFPDSKNFDYDDVDYIIQIEDETVKNSLIEKKLAADPNNYKLQAVIGETIFDKLNGKDTANARPANYDELEQKMISAFVKASELKAGNGFPLSNLGNHFMNKSIAVSKEQEEFRNYMRDKRQAATPAPAAKPKPGTKPVAAKAPADDPADVAKREELKKRYFDAITTAGVYFQKAVDIYSKIPSPTNIEKQQYRNAVSYLIDINRELKDNSKGKLAEYDKFEKEEKKWTAEYSKL